VNVDVTVGDIDVAQLLLTGRAELRYAIDGEEQEPLEIVYEQVEETEMMNFIPQVWEQVVKERAMREQKGYVRFNDMGDGITIEELDRILSKSNRHQIVMPYEPARFKAEEAMLAELDDYEYLQDASRNVGRLAEIQDQEGMWAQEYTSGVRDPQTLSKPYHDAGQYYGLFPNIVNLPPVQPAAQSAPAPATTPKPEPEFGVVVVGSTQVPLPTVNALLSGKFIHEGEELDLSFKQYVVLFHNDDYNRGEARQLETQLRELIRGVNVVLVPVNGG
jgi:hypothetical protein